MVCLRMKDFRRLGDLLAQSHRSLRDNFAVSCPQTDFLAEKLLDYEGVYGARMMGGGFGGCVLALLESAAKDHILSDLLPRYRYYYQLDAAIYPVTISDGASIMGSGLNIQQNE